MFERRPIYRETAKQYQKASKKEKMEILDYFVRITGLKNRNYAARLLRQHGKNIYVGKKNYLKADIAKKGKRPGRKKKFGEEELKLLKKVWEIENYMCGKRLKPILNEVLDNLLANGHLQGFQQAIENLRHISASSIDRLLKHERKKLEIKGRKGTKPGTLLKQQIAIRTWAEWDENCPGFMEIDLVAHEGGNSRGDFAQTLNMVDVWSGWTELVAIKNKASKWVREAIEKVQRRLPFDLRGIDSDTGAEFINHPLRDWCEKHQIKFTRGRSSRSNDNCYVEQKNYSIVRQNVGYFRYDTEEEVYYLNRLYAYLRLYANFFQPVMKMTEKKRIGSKVQKKHDDIKTPYQRLLESSYVSEAQKERLTRLYKALDLFHLRQKITACQRKLFSLQKKKNVKNKNLEETVWNF
ncbi:integrase catalytic domain-containing protein [Thermospira aquatica]|uniref:Transposase family protein n=1 Tax=Thermospira aquatica TaxID=2828656 RepID=A0AAX3BDK3_9SPIR|nr:transposase family protein [Thermospira aquatica]URA10268.1 transposase family protein [Thermospira aquatica]